MKHTWITSVVLVLLGLQALAAVAAAPNITVENAPATVFKHTQRCEVLDIPDAPLRAFRRADGRVVAFATHYLNRSLVGPSLSQLSHECRLVYQGRHLDDPAKFDDRTWITATWTSDGVNVAALGHNEYQAHKFLGRCSFGTYNECWYNSVVPLISSNGGRSFVRANYPEPIAAPPMKSNSGQGRPRGYFSPSNIIFDHGYYYALIARSGFGGKEAGRCLFRTRDAMTPGSWTAWDGASFVPIFGSPYDHDWTLKTPCEAVIGLSRGALGSIAKIKGSDIFAAFSISESSEDTEGGFVDVDFLPTCYVGQTGGIFST